MTKKALKETCKAILHKYGVGAKIEQGSDDFDYLIGIFTNHSAWDVKQGAGVNHITNQKTKYGNKCFVIVRKDLSTTDISYIRCIDKPLTDLAKINKACRTAIWPTIKKYRNDNVVFGETKCEFTHKVLTLENCHIDHYNHQFKVVFSRWMQQNDESELIKHINNCNIDGCVDVMFMDDSIINDFIKFHNANTNLRAVHKSANLGFLK